MKSKWKSPMSLAKTWLGSEAIKEGEKTKLVMLTIDASTGRFRMAHEMKEDEEKSDDERHSLANAKLTPDSHLGASEWHKSKTYNPKTRIEKRVP